MRTRDKRTNSAWAVVAFMCSALAGAPESAQAQEGVPATPAPQGSSMQVTPLKRGWLVAPDVKITQVDDQAATLAGGYVGWVTDGAFLVGAGGYWLANGSDDREMAYGGLVLEWLARTDRRIGFGARTLLGGGTATIGFSYADLLGPMAPVAFGGPPVRFGHRNGRGPGHGFDPGNLTDRTLQVSENFLIAEPQANVLLTLTDWMRIDARRLSPDRGHVSAGRSSPRRQRDHCSPVWRRPLVNAHDLEGSGPPDPFFSAVLGAAPFHAAPGSPSRADLD